MLRQLSLAVVGADYPNRKPRARGQFNRRFEIATCRPGEPIHLILEPDNPVDPLAVMVFSDRDIQIGYVSAERAPLIGKHLRGAEDVRAIFQAATDWGAWIRVSLDGSEPALPPIAENAERYLPDDEGYYSDPIWPDE